MMFSINLIITILMVVYCGINVFRTANDKEKVFFRKITVIVSIISVIWGIKTIVSTVILNNTSGMYLLTALWVLCFLLRCKSIEKQYSNARKRLNQ